MKGFPLLFPFLYKHSFDMEIWKKAPEQLSLSLASRTYSQGHKVCLFPPNLIKHSCAELGI